LATEPGTLKFEILVPQKEDDTIMLYEVYASPEAFEAHWTGPRSSGRRRARRMATLLQSPLSFYFV
jgi:quinol monooxygenase YgiN